ncbi:hypothetical protein A8E62_32025 [Burkholderia cenocepacia]|uniref:Transmembrane protein n=1 Tax=Burkholderia cenocepacia TaxID=95486 RepID=A0A1V2VV56_9BURK|nr:hypothetical protein A8E62_32025 [Burkholderia cenocepacia]ONU66285.1 hypothetical protein A8E68_07365 [Burkholderia cenocepacia]ONU76333.1 hypothetical protein A8E72_34030 [Burkholderia cenocepacia]ONU79500.1 hypothetical protein A8E73_22135 [Burkholderia cenocepacia]ONU88334.1 hypothetical protein A8E63_14670 [Burkholderia cenocepacia]
MTTILIIGLVVLALIVGIFYAGFKIIMIPLRIAFGVARFILVLSYRIMASLFSPLTKNNR